MLWGGILLGDSDFFVVPMLLRQLIWWLSMILVLLLWQVDLRLRLVNYSKKVDIHLVLVLLKQWIIRKVWVSTIYPRFRISAVTSKFSVIYSTKHKFYLCSLFQSEIFSQVIQVTLVNSLSVDLFLIDTIAIYNFSKISISIFR